MKPRPGTAYRPSALGRALRALRERAGLSQIELAAATSLSQSQISRGESGRRLLSPEQVSRYADTCLSRIDPREREAEGLPRERDRLIALAGELEREYADTRAILQRGSHNMQERIWQFETGSALVRAFQPGMVLGQLQSAGYARAVLESRADRSSEEVSRLTDLRERRTALLGDPVRRWDLIQTYGALAWCLGSPAVMVDQLEHLIEVSRLPNVDLGVIPAFRVASFPVRHGFHIYDAAAVRVRTTTATALLSERDDIVRYAELHSRLSALAVRGDEAREILSALEREYRARA